MLSARLSVIAVEPGLTTINEPVLDDARTDDQIRGEADVEMLSSEKVARHARH